MMAILNVTQGKRPPRPVYPTFTEKLWELTQRCWHHNPELRPGASEVLRVLLATSVPHQLYRTSIHWFNYMLTCSDIPSWKQLTSSSLSSDERLALISSIFSDRGEVEAVVQLFAGDAQAFVDVTDEVSPLRGLVFESRDRILTLVDPSCFINQALDSLSAEIRRRCLCYLSGICGRKSLLPKSLPDPLHYDLTEEVQYRGEIATVAKGRYNGRVVAAKIWSGSESDLDQTRRVGAAQLVVF